MSVDEATTTVGCTVNGEARRCPAGTTLGSLLGASGQQRRPVVLECNGRIVPRSRHLDTRIEDGDVIEIVGAVGGG